MLPTGARADRRPSPARRVLRWETLRGCLSRPTLIAAEGSGLFLLVAIQHFHASGTAKALLSASTFLGMLVAPLIVTVVASRHIPVPRALCALMAVSGLALLIAAVSPTLPGFVLGVLLGVPLLQGLLPLVTAVWQAHVPSRRRGRLFGLAHSLAALAGIGSGLAIAAYLGLDAGRYRPVVAVLGAAVMVGGAAALRLPATRLLHSERNPLRLLTLLVRDPVFGYLSAAWMLLGFGNLSTIPLRMEYVASAESGLAYSAQHVLYLLVVIPQAMALVGSVVWGRLFDRFDFLVLRIALNAVFMSSIVLFFTPSLPLQVAGSLLYGMGMGGGAVQWNLWVTRYAPRGRTADYMAVHTFLTGVRGLVAPFLAYALLARLSLFVAVWFGVALLGAATVMVALLLSHERGREP